MGFLLKKMNLKITIVIIIIINLLNINTRNFKIRNFILSLTNTNSLITPKIALGATESGINKIAAEITVRIDGKNRSGSGVIVEKQGKDRRGDGGVSSISAAATWLVSE